MDTENRQERDGRRSVFMRPLFWLVSVVIAALGVALTNALVKQFSDVIDPIVERGPAVSVDDVATYRSDNLGSSVVFPRGTVFSEGDIAELNSQPDPVSWLENRGGVAPSTVFVRMVLTGNRSTPVRVMNVAVDPDCTAPLDGVIFESPPAGAEDSLGLNFDLDLSDPIATFTAESGEEKPFFPERTISLANDEGQVILATASTNRHYCTFRLTVAVLDGSETSTITVPGDGEAPFAVTARVEDRAYEEVYLGGVICPEFVRAGEAYFRGDFLNACAG